MSTIIVSSSSYASVSTEELRVKPKSKMQEEISAKVSGIADT